MRGARRIEFTRDAGDGGLRRIKQKEEAPVFLAIMDKAEFHEKKELFSHHKELLHSLGSIRYCKAEWMKGCVTGTLRIPHKSEQRAPLFSFGFYMTEEILIMVEEVGDLKLWTEKRLNGFHDLQTPDQLLLQIIELMIEDDILYLSHLEKKIEEMEDETLSSNVSDEFFLSLTTCRRKLSELSNFYEQLAGIGGQMQLYPQILGTQRAEVWDKFSGRMEHLQKHVNHLRENVLQLREIFQSMQDARQNKVMGILTVVTTLFLPLTLLTGWYGMNFSHMPEIHWKYGYLAVAGVAVLVVVLEILWFKKKKFF